MGKLEFGGNVDVIQPVVKTGISDSLDFQKKGKHESNTILEINTKEKLDKETNLEEKEILKIVEKLNILNGNRKIYNETLSRIIEFNKNTFLGIEFIDGIISESKLEIDIKEEKENIKEEKENIKEEKENKVEKINSVNEGLIDKSKNREEIKEEIKISEYRLNKFDKNKSNLEEIKNIKNILGNINLDEKYPGIFKLYNNIDTSNNFQIEDSENFDEILNILKNPQTLKSVVKDLKKQDKENGTNTFDVFRESIGGIDAELGEQIDLIDLSDSRAKIMLGSDDLEGVDIGENVLRKETDDGFEVSAGNDGRKLSLQGSDYEMGAGLDNSDEISEFVEVEKELREEIKPLNEELSSVRKILNFVKNAILQNADVGEVKEKIREGNSDLYNELGIEYANSLQSIESKLAGIYKQKQEEKDKIIEEKKEILDELVYRNRQKAIEKNEKQKDTLKFLNSIGLDLIPQGDLDLIISEIKNGHFSVAGLNLNKNNIDLENGSFGEPTTEKSGEGLSLQAKENLVKFFNKMISGDINEPLESSNFTGIMGGRINDTFINAEFNKERGNGVNTIKPIGVWNRSNMIENLKINTK